MDDVAQIVAAKPLPLNRPEHRCAVRVGLRAFAAMSMVLVKRQCVDVRLWTMSELDGIRRLLRREADVATCLLRHAELEQPINGRLLDLIDSAQDLLDHILAVTDLDEWSTTRVALQVGEFGGDLEALVGDDFTEALLCTVRAICEITKASAAKSTAALESSVGRPS